MNRRRYAAVLAAVMLALAAASLYFLWTGSPAEDAGKPDIGDRLAKSVTSEMEDFRFVEEGQRGTRIEVAARKAALRYRKYRQFRLAAGRVLELEAPVFLVYGEDGKATEITGKTAVADPMKKTVVFEDAVAKAPDGSTFEAGRLGWRYADARLTADGPCVIRRGGGAVEGAGVVLDMRLKEIMVK